MDEDVNGFHDEHQFDYHADEAKDEMGALLEKNQQKRHRRLLSDDLHYIPDFDEEAEHIVDPAARKEKLRQLALYTWDFCFVFDVGEADKDVTHRHIVDGEVVEEEMSEKELFEIKTAKCVRKLKAAGLKTVLYLSVQEDEVYCLVGATESRLRQFAARTSYDLCMDTKQVVKQGLEIGLELARGVEDPLPGQDPIDPKTWGRLYGPFKNVDPIYPWRQKLYRTYSHTCGERHKGTVFRQVDRMRLTVGIIESDRLLGGANISIGGLTMRKTESLMAMFPLHDHRSRHRLHTKWLKWWPPISQPLTLIRDYYGEKVAMYFGFLGFYCAWLLAPSVLGLDLFIYQMVDGKIDSGLLPPFGIFIALWATTFLQYWIRKQNYLSRKWGMRNFLNKEHTRPEFQGNETISPVDGKIEKSFPRSVQLLRAAFSQSVIFTMIVAVIWCVVGIFIFRTTLVKWSPSMGGYLAGIVNALQIQILNYIFGLVATKLNDYENHRTETQYENSLIAKTILFKFVNSYNSLFYIAFFKQYDTAAGGCADGDCLAELRTQLATIFIMQLVVNNALEIGKPILMNAWTARKNRQVSVDAFGEEIEVVKSVPETEFELSTYASTFEDYEELVIQFGFVMLFVVAFPLVPLLALFTNYVEIRVDAKKLLTLTRRPHPQGAINIGTWHSVLSIFSFIGIATNILLVVFNTETVDRLADGNVAYKVWFFVAAEHTVVLVKLAIDYLIPDVPASVDLHDRREDYLVDVLLDGVADRVDAGSVGHSHEKVLCQAELLPKSLPKEALFFSSIK